MGLKPSHTVASFIIFAGLISLILTAYNGLQIHYGFEKTGLDENGNNVMDGLNNINIISGINESVTGIYKLSSLTGSQFDILGALGSVGLGFLKVMTGIISFPVEIIGVITGFYYMPPILGVVMGLLFIVYIAFMLLSNYTRSEQ